MATMVEESTVPFVGEVQGYSRIHDSGRDGVVVIKVEDENHHKEKLVIKVSTNHHDC